VLLDENFLLEVDAIAHFHELVGVTGIAVFAGELASAVRVDCPGEGHAHPGATIEQRPDGQGKVFDLVALPQGFTLRSHPSDADQLRFGIGENGQRGHGDIRLLFAIRLAANTGSGQVDSSFEFLSIAYSRGVAL